MKKMIYKAEEHVKEIYIAVHIKDTIFISYLMASILVHT